MKSQDPHKSEKMLHICFSSSLLVQESKLSLSAEHFMRKLIEHLKMNRSKAEGSTACSLIGYPVAPQVFQMADN